MTHEEFKDICLREYPKIEGMVKTVKALGVEYVSCSVYADGHINFDIHEADRKTFHTSWHCAGSKDGLIQMTEHKKDGTTWWAPKCCYDHAIGNDEGIDENLPF